MQQNKIATTTYFLIYVNNYCDLLVLFVNGIEEWVSIVECNQPAKLCPVDEQLV